MRGWLLGVATALAGCTPPSAGCAWAELDAEASCDSAFKVRLGLGETDWAPLGDDGALPLVRGPQGLQHVDLAATLDLDAASLPTDRALISLAAWRLDDATPVSPMDEWGVGFAPAHDTPTLVGLRLVVVDPEPALGARLGVLLTVTPVGADDPGRGWLEGELRWLEE